ncbi:MAG TPA: tetraacyldisaccharide 4'-kinase [Pseudomonadales bacterium]|nr:tetraacyldisaccharide 4'-kinase [Pseudomonadales bacterium]
MKTLNNALERGWYPGGDKSRSAIWFWPFLMLLWPLSKIFSWLAAQRRQHLQRVQAVLPVAVVVVGNISVGGTGKTPLLCELAKELSKRGKRVGVISRGYGGGYDGQPRLVQESDDVSQVGDEPLLIARLVKCPVVIAHDRLAAARFLIKQASVDIILSDDGLQHYTLPRTVEIVVLDGVRGIGNGFCLPAGPLREPVSRLHEVDFVVVNGATSHTFNHAQLVTQLVPEYWTNIGNSDVIELEKLPESPRVHAVAGIGNPQRFFDTLRSLGLDIIEHAFPDHHMFTARDIRFDDNFPIVMTEKDAVKCTRFAQHHCYALHVQMPLPAQWVSQLVARIERNFHQAGMSRVT